MQPREDVNDDAPFMARATGMAASRWHGLHPSVAARVDVIAVQLTGSVGNPIRGVTWPVRAGVVPALADAFTGRADSVPGIEAALVPGTVVVLVPGEEGAGGGHGWPESCGKTQLASCLAESLWRSRQVDLLAWVNAASRASVVSAYAEAAARLGLDHGGDAESVAARFAAWLGGTVRRWVVVLDDLRDAADLDGLWPGGLAGRVLVTARDAERSGAGYITDAHALRFTLGLAWASIRESSRGQSDRSCTTEPRQF